MEHQIRLRKSGAQIDMFHKTRRLLKISAGKTWKFFGGVKAPSLKHASDKPIEVLGIPSLITLPLERYLGKKGSVLVQPGDHVKRGQVLTDPRDNKLVPLHASTSGTILRISNQLLPHPSGFTGECITIKPDGLDDSRFVIGKPSLTRLSCKRSGIWGLRVWAALYIPLPPN